MSTTIDLLARAAERACAEAGKLSREGDGPASDAMMAEADELSMRAERFKELERLVFTQKFMGGRRELMKAMRVPQVTRALRRSRAAEHGPTALLEDMEEHGL